MCTTPSVQHLRKRRRSKKKANGNERGGRAGKAEKARRESRESKQASRRKSRGEEGKKRPTYCTNAPATATAARWCPATSSHASCPNASEVVRPVEWRTRQCPMYTVATTMALRIVTSSEAASRSRKPFSPPKSTFNRRRAKSRTFGQ